MIWEGIHAQSPMGIVIAARELGKSDFLSVGHDFSMRKNVGKKWVCLLKSVGKVESNEVFCRAMEEEEGGEKLVESLLFAAVEMMMSNQGVDHVIEKKKTNYVMVVLSDEVEADNELEVVLYYSTMTWLYVIPFHFNVMDQPDDLTLVRPSRSGAMTAIGTARRSLAPIDVQRADRYNESIGRYDRYSPTVTQGVWPYRLISYPFKMKKYALYSS
ncbi:hypothetical protein L249_7400 [Ophiocordyceps polyrhachis-furcata BCC 54312]|uniref:Uncharacterized protein n=1 Tax=Ophiocordyceps polyrhachis-furcata BCC 54312 TaxID=1330021 RepID=A0A367L9T7_9HYPO|nr:hypothetical protein L249_7400 [Ophiocordyceps polyrhachis-furcata BCC 54312]